MFVAAPSRLPLLTLWMPDPHQRGLDFGRRHRCVPPLRDRRTELLETATHEAFPVEGVAPRLHCVTGSFKERDSNPRPEGITFCSNPTELSSGGVDGIRTRDLSIDNRMLYQTELPLRFVRTTRCKPRHTQGQSPSAPGGIDPAPLWPVVSSFAH